MIMADIKEVDIPQVVQNPSMLQPAEITNAPTIPQPDQTFQRSSKDSGSLGDRNLVL